MRRKYSCGSRSTEVIERYAERNRDRAHGDATGWHLRATGVCDRVNLRGSRRVVAGSDISGSVNATRAGSPRPNGS